MDGSEVRSARRNDAGSLPLQPGRAGVTTRPGLFLAPSHQVPQHWSLRSARFCTALPVRLSPAISGDSNLVLRVYVEISTAPSQKLLFLLHSN
ncbi:hypothetical protein BX600DRAFT_115931 [Xylariales sp. PMI_506]|nr:hypothetical protein BX600DRAFT_115931 [Xylariales sp. PMI_506]